MATTIARAVALPATSGARQQRNVGIGARNASCRGEKRSTGLKLLSPIRLMFASTPHRCQHSQFAFIEAF